VSQPFAFRTQRPQKYFVSEAVKRVWVEMIACNTDIDKRRNPIVVQIEDRVFGHQVQFDHFRFKTQVDSFFGIPFMRKNADNPLWITIGEVLQERRYPKELAELFTGHIQKQ